MTVTVGELPRTVPSFVTHLAQHGARTALVGPGGPVSYADLAAQVAVVARRLGPTRRLVLVEATSTVPGVVGYLGALAGGHAVLLVAPCHGRGSEVVARYRPDVVVGADGDGGDAQDGVRIDAAGAGSGHELHPDVALLMSTSGSTGSPRLVRLSATNLQANAESIASSLGIDESDVAVTTLPLHYCYGLSVLHSHLLRGATVVLTSRSVVDARLWDLVREHRVTSFAGVPYTFELLDRVGFATRDLPHLRYVTQAGGRMAPERVRRFAELGQRRGFDLVVMYGQTEATARMAYLPPPLALDHPAAVGVAVPGGSFRLDPVDDAHAGQPGQAGDVGEVVYTGPNVMLGYADSPADLALGRTVHELRTGDVGRVDEAGLLEIVGRRSRVAKVLGLRIDLDRVDAALADTGLVAACVGRDDVLVVGVELAGSASDEHVATPAAARAAAHAAAVAAKAAGLPDPAVVAVPVPSLPRLPSGKPDLVTLADLVCPAHRGPQGTPDLPADEADEPALVALYATVLRRPDADAGSTFVGLGGDSLSYVELSVQLADRLGRLPDDWPTTTIGDLAAGAARPGSPAPLRASDQRGWWRRQWVDTAVLLRAVAIVAIVASHIGVVHVLGGAHVLLAAAGYSYARFQLTPVPRLVRVRRQVRSVARIVVPSVLVIGAATLLTGAYEPTTVLLLNGLITEPGWSAQRHFWFVEILVYLLVLGTALLAVPILDAAERRHAFGVALAVLAVGLVLRYEVVTLGWTATRPVLWLFALGWAAARAGSRPGRWLLSAAAAWGCWGFFDDPARDGLILAGVLALIWVRQVRLPAPVVAVAGPVAAGSLYVYLTHWQVYPVLGDQPGWVAVLGCLAAGLAAWQLSGWVGALAGAWSGAVARRASPRLRAAPRPRAAPTG